MGASVSPEPLSDHDFYDQLRDNGLSHADAVKHVELRRTAVANPTTQAPGLWPPDPSQIGWAAPVAFGHGASVGVAGDSAFLAAAHEANPKTMFAADLLGTAALGGAASPLVAGVSPMAGAAVLSGAMGAARGAVEPIAGLSRKESALVMGLGGTIGGALAGKLVSKVLPVAVAVGRNAGKLFGKIFGTAAAKSIAPTVEGAAAKVAVPEIKDIEEAAMRAYLKRQNFHPAVAEQVVQAWKTGKVPQGAIDLPPMEPTVSRVGETITPTEPQLPMMRAQPDVMATQPAYVRAGNPNNLPTGTGPMAPSPPGMPLGASGTLQALEQQLGRPLTPPETQSVLERLLGPIGRLPQSYGRPP